MKKIVGWILLSVGCVYPVVLIHISIFWLYAFSIDFSSEKMWPIIVQPVVLILSLILITIGILLVRRKHAKKD